MDTITVKLKSLLRERFPLVAEGNSGALDEADPALAHAAEVLSDGGLSWAVLNQILHRASEAGMSEGFFRYYFLHVPAHHPYDVRKVWSRIEYRPPDSCIHVESLEQLEWGFTRFTHDAMLFWGNFRQAYRDLRRLSFRAIEQDFSDRRLDDEFPPPVAGQSSRPKQFRAIIATSYRRWPARPMKLR